MAFPESVKTFIEAVDPSSIEDIQKIQEYQSLLESGNFNAASALLSSMENGIKMNISAGRFNDVLSEIIAIEKFYFGLNGVREYIQKNLNAYGDLKDWDRETIYYPTNIARRNGSWYICIKENTNVEPGVGEWEQYWELFVRHQGATQIQSETPTDQVAGDLWFKIIE